MGFKFSYLFYHAADYDAIVLHDHWFLLFAKNYFDYPLSIKRMKLNVKKALMLKSINEEDVPIIEKNKESIDVVIYNTIASHKEEFLRNHDNVNFKSTNMEVLIGFLKFRRMDLVEYFNKFNYKFISFHIFKQQLNEINSNMMTNMLNYSVKCGSKGQLYFSDYYSAEDIVDFGTLKNMIFSKENVEEFFQNITPVETDYSADYIVKNMDRTNIIIFKLLEDFLNLKKNMINTGIVSFDNLSKFYGNKSLNPLSNTPKIILGKQCEERYPHVDNVTLFLSFLEKLTPDKFRTNIKKHRLANHREAAVVAAITSCNKENVEPFKRVHEAGSMDGEPAVTKNRKGSQIEELPLCTNVLRGIGAGDTRRIQFRQAVLLEFGINKIYSDEVSIEFFNNCSILSDFTKINSRGHDDRLYSNAYANIEIQAKANQKLFYMCSNSISQIANFDVQGIVSLFNKTIKKFYFAYNFLGCLPSINQKDYAYLGVYINDIVPKKIDKHEKQVND
jgi:hypothetical protein